MITWLVITKNYDLVSQIFHYVVFNIVAPDNTIIKPKRQWYWQKDRVEEAIKNNELEFKKDKEGFWTVHTKQYLKNEDGSIREAKVFSIIDDVYSQHGTNEIIDMFKNAKIFSYPKPVNLLNKLLQVGIGSKNKNDIVLDFFAGSGTTFHAVMALNAEDGGNRKFITVQIPEKTDEKSEAFSAGYETIFLPIKNILIPIFQQQPII